MIFSKKDKRQSSMIEALTEPAYIFGEDGSFLHSNRAGREFLKLLGYDNSRKPEHFDAFTQVLRFSGEKAGQPSLHLGSRRYTLSNGSFDDGTLLRLMPMQEDEHLLRLSSALSAVPWGLVSVDLSSEACPVLFCNEKAGHFLQVLPPNITGQSMMDVFRIFGIKDNMSGYFQDGDITHYDFESRCDERVCWFRFHFIPYKVGGPLCLIVIEDTTEAKIMEGQYFQSQRLEALGQLAGGVAHDFNNILSIISGYARIADKAVEGNDEALNYLERISQAVDRGSALTSQLLTFGRHKVRKDSVFDLGELVTDQEALLRPLMDASISLSIRVDPEIPVELPADHICQILMNLCINSRDAMPDGGHLIVEVVNAKDGEHALLRVIDTGSGMSPEVKRKIFDPFFTTKDQGKGTGLGLSMVYGLVRDMKGEIDVVSKLGSGTAITIQLPLSTREQAHHEIIEHEDGSVTLSGFTAMVAEDEPDLLNLLSGMLEEMGMKVLRASNGAEALIKQDEYQGDIDFLLTDVVMPEVNGVKLAEMFEQVRPSSKIMFISGYPARGDLARVSVPEGAFLMPKPLDFKKLGMVMKNMAIEQNNYMKERLKRLTGQWKTA